MIEVMPEMDHISQIKRLCRDIGNDEVALLEAVLTGDKRGKTVTITLVVLAQGTSRRTGIVAGKPVQSSWSVSGCESDHVFGGLELELLTRRPPIVVHAVRKIKELLNATSA